MSIRNSSLCFRLGATAFLLTLAGGFMVPFTPRGEAAPAPAPVPAPASSSSVASASSAAGVVDLSPTPPNDTQGAPPNVVVTFDDSGSMAWDYMGDTPPFNYTVSSGWGGGTQALRWQDGPWYCAGVIDPTATSGLGTLAMNGVYYNPNVTYDPPVYADGGNFPDADDTLEAVQNDGVSANRPLNPTGVNNTTNFMSGIGWYKSSSSGTAKYGTFPSGYGYYSTNDESDPPGKNDYHHGNYPRAWTCPYGSSSPSNVGSGPYYYKYTGPTLTDNGYGAPSNLGDLYNASNWTAVAVPSSQYQNWANWWAYYHTRNLMARTALSRVFGSSSLANKVKNDTDGSGISDPTSYGFGNDIRVAWQTLYDGYSGIYDKFVLQPSTIISGLIDTTPTDCKATILGSQSLLNGTTKTPPSCYRSDFFNWIFQVPANSGTPTRSAVDRAGQFFERGGVNDPNNVAKGDLHDPYWQPSDTGQGDGNELFCRQNFHMLITDGLWNGNGDGPKRSTLTLPSNVGTLPDHVSFPSTRSGVGSIYADVGDAGDKGYASMSDIAFHYWATNLRPDLYKPDQGQYVSPYLPDTRTNLFGLTGQTGSQVDATDINSEIYFNPANDPATWPHMSEYMIGLGVNGTLNYSDNTDCTDTSGVGADACDLRKGETNSSSNIGWPSPDGTSNGIAANIDDTWHAALAGRGQFFSASNPQNLVDQLTKVLSSISARSSQPSTSAVNSSVLTSGSLSFQTGYSSADWTGVLKAVTLKSDGSIDTLQWDASADLDARNLTSNPRKVLTAVMNGDDTITGADFTATTAFDSAELAGLETPALDTSSGSKDTLANRVNYLLGSRAQENDGTMRKRNHLLGAIIDSQALYVSYPSSGYTDNWPAGSPEATAAATSNGTDDKSYDSFVSDHADRPGTLYVGANDGMLHAFDASLKCNSTDANGNCISYGPDQAASAGQELWAYVPRAVYDKLGNLTSASDFQFEPTVNGSPVTRDVFFGNSSDSNTDNKWHTILVGGLRLGGRGVYALDVTNPIVDSSDPTAMSASKVLWEFDADSPASAGCVTNDGSACNPQDLGYTYGQPNIGRLADGKWVVIVPTGYYPDCNKADKPSNCQTLAAASNKYSALFVLDAQTGAQIAELKTPTNISGVTSYGLSSPVLGDYNNDQIDDVAYAGDLAGNLWRFDLSSSTETDWSVSLAYKGMADSGGNQGLQPITVMPRLFPDPATNRFMVVFGTGKYLGADDNTSTSAATQSVYGIRDKLDSSGKPVTITRSDLQSQTLGEEAGTGDLAGNTLRTLTDNTVAADAGGWYFDLLTQDSNGVVTDAGERVVVTPSALFDTNTAIIETLIPSSTDPCDPTVSGAIMLVDATTGGAGSGVSSVGGFPYVGARVDNVRTSGTIPVMTMVGGGKGLLPGVTLTGSGGGSGDTPPLGIDRPVWRRRSWSVINNVH